MKTLYMLKSPGGKLIGDATPIKSDAKHSYCPRIYYHCFEDQWKLAKKRGWSIVKVKVTEVK